MHLDRKDVFTLLQRFSGESNLTAQLGIDHGAQGPRGVADAAALLHVRAVNLLAVEIKHCAVVDEVADLQLAAPGRLVEVKHLAKVKRGGPHLERGGHFVFLPGGGASKVRLAAWPGGVVVFGLAPGGAQVFAIGVVPPLRVLEGNEIRRLGVAAVAETGLRVGQ